VIRDLEQRHASGDDYTGDVHSLIFQSENPMSDLNWLCSAISLLKALLRE
jgi:hypothetical protein